MIHLGRVGQVFRRAPRPWRLLLRSNRRAASRSRHHLITIHPAGRPPAGAVASSTAVAPPCCEHRTPGGELDGYILLLLLAVQVQRLGCSHLVHRVCRLARRHLRVPGLVGCLLIQDRFRSVGRQTLRGRRRRGRKEARKGRPGGGGGALQQRAASSEQQTAGENKERRRGRC